MSRLIVMFGTVMLLASPIIPRFGGGAASGGGLPLFTFTGTFQLLDDGKVDRVRNWRLRILSSGNLVFLGVYDVDVFLVGGGAGGSYYSYENAGGGGGGGGFTLLNLFTSIKDATYIITIGAGGNPATYGTAGGTTSITTTGLSMSALGGNGSPNGDPYRGGSGGSGGGGSNGGAGGTNGGNGAQGGAPYYATAGTGAGVSTKEFRESTGTLYATGGYGSPANPTVARTANTGDGGYGGRTAAQNGASGILIIRNHRAA